MKPKCFNNQASAALGNLQYIFQRNIMKKTLIQLLTISCLLAANSLNSVAQEKKPRPDESRPQKPMEFEFKAPPDSIFKFLWPKFAIGKVVKGAPYSATATT